MNLIKNKANLLLMQVWGEKAKVVQRFKHDTKFVKSAEIWDIFR